MKRTKQTITLGCLHDHGDILCTIEGERIPIRLGIPGETVEIEISENKRYAKKGRVNKVLNASPHRTTPPCPYFGTCGGCQWQHIKYPFQLKLKRDIVINQLEEIGKIDNPYVTPTIASPKPLAYRNHARFSVDRNGSLGFTKVGTRNHLKVDKCILMHEQINAVLTEIQDKCQEKRQISVRNSIETNTLLVQPTIEGMGISFSSGDDHYYESLFGYGFKVSSPSFFQVNIQQAERIITELRDRLLPNGAEVLIDAYGGVGAFAVMLAPYYRKVISIEESPSAIKDAQINCKPFKNVTIISGKTETILKTLNHRPDAIILDPPRIGCHPDVLKAITLLPPSKIAYVSCDTGTLARDIAILCSTGYDLKETVPVDMFPQTQHIESISILEKGY